MLHLDLYVITWSSCYSKQSELHMYPSAFYVQKSDVQADQDSMWGKIGKTH